MTVARRTLLILPALVAWPGIAAAQGGAFPIDWRGGPRTPDVAASLAAQVALIRSLRIEPGIAAFFAAQVITVDLAPNTATRAGPRSVFFERRPVPADNPLLLHELLHRYHLLRLSGGVRNRTVSGLLEQARRAGFPPSAYILTNALELFPMTASVVLYGHAARPPRTRENVRERLPELYAWIVREFGLIV